MKPETKDKVIKSICNAKELGWIKYFQDPNVTDYISVADVEKLIIGLFEPDYIENLKRIKREVK